MLQTIRLAAFAGLCTVMFASGTASAAEVFGHYMEARTCQVYTGPCFANGEVGLAGHDAVMAWSVGEGRFDDVDISGLKVVMVVRASETLGFRGLDNAKEVKSLLVVDNRADQRQRQALIDFAKENTGKAGKNIARVEFAPIAMELDEYELNGKLSVDKCVKLETRRARKGDCICSNESAYYPPLAKVENFAPGVTLNGEFTGRGLGTRWSIPDTRSAYMATFAY